jgi:hypothetical protein
MGMLPNTKMNKDKAVPSSTILCQDLNGEPFHENGDSYSIVGKLGTSSKRSWGDPTRFSMQCSTSAHGSLAANQGSPLPMQSRTSTSTVWLPWTKTSFSNRMYQSPSKVTLTATLLAAIGCKKCDEQPTLGPRYYRVTDLFV